MPGNDHGSDMDVATKKKTSSKKHAGPKTTATAKVVPKKSATAKPVSKGSSSKVKKVEFDSESDIGNYWSNFTFMQEENNNITQPNCNIY